MLEETDRQIVGLLSRAGRMSFTDLAGATGLSVSAAHQRVRRLVERGVIKEFRAVINPAELGLGLTAFVSLTPIDPARPDDAPERLAGLAAVEACHSVAGQESYILQVRVTGPAELEALLAEIRSISGMATRTTVVLSTAWEGRPALE